MSRVTGNSRLAKQINRSLILHQIRKKEKISRTDLAQITGLTSGTISNITGELLQDGVIVASGTMESSGGRPQVLLELNASAFLALGVNISSTRLVALLTDLNGKPLKRLDEHLRTELPVEQQLEQIIATIEELLDHDQSRERVIGAGVGIPGLLDSEQGISRFLPNLGWVDVPVKEILQARLQLPVFIDNSVRLGALGEKWWGAGTLKRDVIALYVGSGVGAGIIINGEIFYGCQESAGEIGHVVVAEGGDLCGCGKRGCLEAIASGPAIARSARALLDSGRPSLLRDSLAAGQELSGALVCEAARHGDSVGLEVMTRAAHYIGVGMSILINLFNPEVLVFNGGVSNSWDITGPTILKTVESRAMPGQVQAARIVQSKLGDTAGPLGGSSLIVDKFFSSPADLNL